MRKNFEHSFRHNAIFSGDDPQKCIAQILKHNLFNPSFCKRKKKNVNGFEMFVQECLSARNISVIQNLIMYVMYLPD